MVDENTCELAKVSNVVDWDFVWFCPYGLFWTWRNGWKEKVDTLRNGSEVFTFCHKLFPNFVTVRVLRLVLLFSCPLSNNKRKEKSRVSLKTTEWNHQSQDYLSVRSDHNERFYFEGDILWQCNINLILKRLKSCLLRQL